MEFTINEALKKGIYAHKAGDLEVAERYYNSILKIEPKHAHANHNKGLLAVSAGKVEKSVPLFEIALEANSGIAQFWLSYMDALIHLNRISDAKNVLDKARLRGAKGENFDRIERKLGAIEDSSSNFDVYRKQMSSPNILDGLSLDQAILMAKQNYKAGEFQKAEKIYKDVLERFPKNNRAIKGVKRVWDRLKEETSIYQTLPQEQMQSLINLYHSGKLKEVLKNGSLLLNRYPNSYSIYNIMGVAHAGLAQFDLAIQFYKKALEVRPNYAEAYLNLGSSFKGKGDLDMAIESYEQALKIKPDYAEAHYNMGNVFKTKGEKSVGSAGNKNFQFDTAIECYKKAIKIRFN